MSQPAAMNTTDTMENSSNLQITGILMALDGFIADSANKISDSLALHDIGEETEITKLIKGAIEDPVGNIATSNEGIGKVIETLKIGLIKSLAVSRKAYLNFAAYSNEDNATHFFIGLKEDTEDNRNIFYELLEDYENHSLSDSHPLIYHFVTNDLLEGVFNLNTISLDEQASKSVSS